MSAAKGKGRTMKVPVVRRPDKPDSYTFAESELRPEIRNAHVINEANGQLFMGETGEDWNGVEVLRDMVAVTRSGDMSLPSDLLTAQSITLDAVFTKCLRRSMLNMDQYPEAAERYMRMALKAQANARSSIEALARLHAPREQTVRHVHVHEGGQAMVAENITVTGGQNGKAAQLPHEPFAALLGANAGGNGVPIASDQGQAPLQNARRKEPRRRKGQPLRAQARATHSGVSGSPSDAA